MSLARYELKSVPGTFIDIPRPYARKAEAFVKRVLETPLVLQENSSDLAYLTNPGLLASVCSLTKSPTFAHLQDAVYLRVCTVLNQRDTSGLKRIQKDRLDDTLIELVRQVESQY